MPIYTFKCDKCGKLIHDFFKTGEKPDCCECGGEYIKQFGNVYIDYKSEGFTKKLDYGKDKKD